MCGEMIGKLYTYMWGDNATHMERGYIYREMIHV